MWLGVSVILFIFQNIRITPFFIYLNLPNLIRLKILIKIIYNIIKTLITYVYIPHPSYIFIIEKHFALTNMAPPFYK